jgi:small subunit ribosomal protein S20
MPHTRSAKKNLRKSEKRRLHNRTVIRTIKTQIKKVQGLAGSANPEELVKEFRAAVKKLDQAAAKRIIHANMAARKKSQLARLLNKKPAAGTSKA